MAPPADAAVVAAKRGWAGAEGTDQGSRYLMLQKIFDAFAFDFKMKWWSLLLFIPIFLVCRYVVFGNRSEFAEFFGNLKLILLPLAVGLATLTMIAAWAMRTDNSAKLTNALVVLNSIVLVIALIAVMIYTKMQLT